MGYLAFSVEIVREKSHKMNKFIAIEIAAQKISEGQIPGRFMAKATSDKSLIHDPFSQQLSVPVNINQSNYSNNSRIN